MKNLKLRHVLGGALATALFVTPAFAQEEQTLEESVAAVEASIERARTTEGPGSPALWTLKDEDTTIYMFGTVHLLKPETEWRSADVDAAFAASERIIFEADTDGAEAEALMGQLIPKYGIFTDGSTLNSVLDDEDEPVLEAALAEIGIPFAAVQPMKPWLVGLQLAVMQMQQAGFDPNSGVETILTAEAKEADKTFGYLETLEEQISILGGGDIEDQVDGLMLTAETMEYGSVILNTLVDEWADGDVVGLGEMMADPVSFGGEDAYQAILVNRNRNWVPQIKAMLDEPGTVFVAVGAAHLAGDDSVINMLRADGLTVTGQ